MLTIEHAHLKGWNNTWLESDFNFGGVSKPLEFEESFVQLLAFE
jgi:hypothetical protein